MGRNETARGRAFDPYRYVLKYACERIYKKIKLFFPNAKIIFALSTSVIEKNAPVGYVRYNKEIEQYNVAAKELMNRLDVTVNDLYSITQTFDQSCYSDWVHPNEKGARIFADAIIKSIGTECSI